MKWLLLIVIIVVALASAALVLLFPMVPVVSQDEVARVASPDGRLDAVLVETNGGATTSFGYLVYITQSAATPPESPVASLYGAVRSKSAYGANLRWEDANRLTIEFLDTRKSELISPRLSVGTQEVTVRLQPGIADPTAPPGGMLYNLKGR